jgi:hypothetical protein
MLLLPIVLLLASAGSAQQAADVAAPAQQIPHGKPLLDKGMILPNNSCIANGTCKTGCLSITAYVFSDGENPKLQYVTHCPNLDVPYQNKRAHHHVPDTEKQPALRDTKN